MWTLWNIKNHKRYISELYSFVEVCVRVWKIHVENLTFTLVYKKKKSLKLTTDQENKIMK